MSIPSNSYIFNKLSECGAGGYYGNQEYHVQQANLAIENCASMLNRHFSDRENAKKIEVVQAVFKSCMAELAGARGQLAKDQQIKFRSRIEGEGFGRPRDGRELSNVTSLIDPRYREYGERYTSNIASLLRKLPGSGYDFHKECKSYKDTENSVLKIRCLDSKEVQQLGTHQIRKCGKGDFEVKNGVMTYSKQFKTSNPEEYKKEVLASGIRSMLSTLQKTIPEMSDEKSRSKLSCIHVVSRLKTTRGLVALTQQLIPFIKGDSPLFLPPALIHQDHFLIEEMMNDAVQVFGQAMQWRPGDDPNVLKQCLGRIRYLLAHAMPYDRGSASISEWLEAAICKAKGFSQFTSSKDVVMDLEALTALSYVEFMEKYFEKTNLGDLEAPIPPKQMAVLQQEGLRHRETAVLQQEDLHPQRTEEYGRLLERAVNEPRRSKCVLL